MWKLCDLTRVAIAAAFLVSAPVHAETPNVARGKAFAERWCARCHAIEAGHRSAEPGIPSFMRMAADPENTRSALRQFITIPHFEMPPQSLTTAEIDDVIAYILSLRR